tara:strand:- start:19 stop:180 length:162 start_codon:yes stop_codon:yes gene_type:complete
MDIPLEVLLSIKMLTSRTHEKLLWNTYDIVWFECFVGLDLAILSVVSFASCTI